MADPKIKTILRMLILMGEVLFIFPVVMVLTSISTVLLMFLSPSAYEWIFKTFGTIFYGSENNSCFGLVYPDVPLDYSKLGLSFSHGTIAWYCLDMTKILIFILAVTLVLSILFEFTIRRRYMKIA